jgi:hypothetical protein
MKRITGCGFPGQAPQGRVYSEIMDPNTLMRQAVYREILRLGEAPSLEGLAEAAELTLDAARQSLAELAEAHVLVLMPDAETVRYAAPFAGGPTGFRVRAGKGSWYAPCAWDAFGIPAALHSDADIDARCAFSSEPLACGVSGGIAYGKAVVHMLIPAARFWEDIVYT